MKALLLTFPFPIFVDRSNPPRVTEIEVGGLKYRVYPPFRSGPANWLGAPGIRADKVPFVDGQALANGKANSTFLTVAAHPMLGDEAGKLAAMQLIWTAEWESPPRMYPMDSLRVDALTEAAGEIAHGVNDVVQRLISMLRAISKQWWLGKALDPMQGWYRNEFEINELGGQIGDANAIARGQAPVGCEIPVDEAVWTKALMAVGRMEKPLIADELLLDAWYYRACSDYRRMVIDCATACEIEKDLAFERIWVRSRSGAYRQGKAQRGYDITTHLDSDIRRLGQRPLSEDDPGLFREIGWLWQARGNVAHGKAARYVRNEKLVVVDEATSMDLLNASRRCMQWLRGIT